MKRRCYIQATVAALAAHGALPLLAANPKNKKMAVPAYGSSRNQYTVPCAIEPITGVLPDFLPAAGPAMAGSFQAKYALSAWDMAREKSVNKLMGSAELSFTSSGFRTTEIRTEFNGRAPASTLKTEVRFGAGGTSSAWSHDALSRNIQKTQFVEKGKWDGKRVVVESKGSSRQYVTQNPLIHRWGLLPLVASGTIKKTPLVFDMLDDAAIRYDQTIDYEGKIQVPLQSGVATLDSYVQTGCGIVPMHYLVDQKGRVQLITIATVNWLLKE